MGNVYYTMVILSKVGGLRPMSTSLMTKNRKIQQYTKLTCIKGIIGSVIRHISTSTITIKNFSMVFKVIVSGLLSLET